MARRFTTLLLLAATIFTTMQARTEHIDITTPQGTLKAILQVPMTAESKQMPLAIICLLDGEDHMYEGRENRPASIVAEFLEKELK